VWFWIAAIGVLALDQLTKHAVLTSLSPGESRPAIPNVLYFTYVQNFHGAMGLFGSSPVLLIGLAVVVLGLFWWAFRDLASQSLLVRIGFGAIVGGAIGNIIDRVKFHYVVDFIDLRWFWVFNVADSCITIGVGLLIIATILRDRQAARSTPS